MLLDVCMQIGGETGFGGGEQVQNTVMNGLVEDTDESFWSAGGEKR